MAEKCMTEANLSITAEDGIELVELAISKFEQATRSKKFEGFSEGLALLVELVRRFKALAEEHTFLNLATVYFTIDDEDPRFYLSSYRQKKIDAWEMDDNAKSFFLLRAAERTGFFSNISDQDILIYLKETQPSLEKITDFLSRRTFVNLCEK